MNDENRLHSPTRNTPHRVVGADLVDEISSTIAVRLEASRRFLDDAPDHVCDGMNSILDDVSRHLDCLGQMVAEAQPARFTNASEHQRETTARSTPPLPEETGRTLGPGHIDMAFERLEEARGIAGLLYSALDSGGELPGADVACMGQRRLLEEAEEHLNAFYAEVRQERQNQNGGGS